MQFIRRSYVDDFSSHVVVVVTLRAEGGRAVGRSGGRAVGRSGGRAVGQRCVESLLLNAQRMLRLLQGRLKRGFACSEVGRVVVEEVIVPAFAVIFRSRRMDRPARGQYSAGTVDRALHAAVTLAEGAVMRAILDLAELAHNALLNCARLPLAIRKPLLVAALDARNARVAGASFRGAPIR